MQVELTPQAMLAHLKERVAAAGSQREFARRAGFSEAYVSDVLSGRRDISPAIADAVGYRIETVFVANEPRGEAEAGKDEA